MAILAALAAAVLILIAVFRPSGDLPDFRQFEAGAARKAAFLEYLRPLVAQANAALEAERARLEALAGDDGLGHSDHRWLRRTAARFEVEFDAERPRAAIDLLLRRLDTIPESLALAQAAKESGWGTSRFAREGNNLFGEWCFSAGCGIVPANRAKGRTHEVRSFDTPLESVESYLMTLNTHPAYDELRSIRARLRRNGHSLSGLRLAEGLSRYSERGAVYVDEIRAMIRFNDLE